MQPGSEAPDASAPAVRGGVVSGHYGRDLVAASHSMLGLKGLFDELAAQGIRRDAVLADIGVDPAAFDVTDARLSHRDKIALFRGVQRCAPAPGTGLRAGQRQRLSDFGVYGYALSSSATFGDAVSFGIRHIRLAGPVLEKRFRVERDIAIFEGRDVLDLGELLPLVSEFWFSSVNTLIERVMERPLPAYRLLLPYPPPLHAAMYGDVFGCPVDFDTDVMEWHFDPAFLSLPCPNANRITSELCRNFCARMVESLNANEPALIRQIREFCLSAVGGPPGIEAMAARLHVSTRTLQRRLADSGYRYQDILDDVRHRLAREFLHKTDLSVETIAARVGFSDASNFRKAFKRWAGQGPAEFRRAK